MTKVYHSAQQAPTTSGIYCITCTITKRFYIGSAINLRSRWWDHRKTLRSNTHRNSKLQNAWNKYGEDAFTFEVIEFVLVPFLLEREQYWFDKLQPFGKKGFNIATNAGSALGRTCSPETKAKLSLINLGRKDSKETIRKRADAIKGRPQSAQAIENRRLARGWLPIETIRARYDTINMGNLQNYGSHDIREKKTLIVIAPNGIGYYVHGVRQFCKEHGLDRSTLMRVAKGECLHHKGWIALFPPVDMI